MRGTCMDEQLIHTKFGIRLNKEQVDNIDKLCRTYMDKWHTVPNPMKYRFLDYDTIVNTLNLMIETGDNFAKAYMQLYFDDIRERYDFNIHRYKSIY